ncbi:MAG: glycosyltransferase family 2 protein [Cyclobacteriaceae bacterium]|nr:glycosyltransferase family 2 protein [Cyclobacteriaceae bacterium]MDH4295009.1 glycosyltransferase family 2 protein [Cyclobacteriaceae bacterium]MDH5247610.1 glycosyltransferase family 2 protein [Cyclobacteriaceae bacterium]
MSRTAIVILNYNGEKLLRQFLPAVLKYSGAAEIIVADNASSDQSLAILRQDFQQVKLIQLDRNYGFCAGYNRALKQVDADYYVLLNSDIEVTPEWLTPMIQLLDGDRSIAAAQPKICSYYEKNKFEHAGAAGGFIDSLGYPFCRGRIFNHIEIDNGQYNDVREIFWASGACLMIRSEIFHRFGGFDEDFFAHMEEIDLCWKIQRTKQRVFYCGLSTVYHVGAATLAYGNPQKVYLNFRNGLSLIYKHLNAFELVFKLPIRLILDWMAAFSFLLRAEWRSSLAVFRAHFDFFVNIGRDRLKRREIQQKPHYSRVCVKHGLIIFDYYLRRKKSIDKL